MAILVVGSFMTDLVARTSEKPSSGQTIIGNEFNLFLGGKGANQAVSAHRQGSSVKITGALGSDQFGKEFKLFFSKEGFDTSHILDKNESSGIGHIVVDEKSGENQIIIIPGANLSYTTSDLMAHEHLFTNSNIVMNQLEMNFEVNELSKKLANKYQALYLLNPAPYRFLSDEFLNGIDILTPNETELEGLLNKPLKSLKDIESAAKEINLKGVSHVIVTLGSRGALHCHQNNCHLYPAFPITEVLDSTGAGDTFNGALAAMLDQGLNMDDAIIHANAAAALCVMKKGAIPSIPNLKEVKEFINERKKKSV